MNQKILRLLALLTLQGVLANVLPAQTAGVEWLTTKEGLSQGFIGKMLQDREGFMWFGTKNGLNRYDGYRFEVFTHDPYDEHSLSADDVASISEYGDFLMVGTRTAGLNFFHKKTRQVYRLPNEVLLPGFPSDNVFILGTETDVDNNLWVQAEIPGVLDRMIKITVPPDFWENPAAHADWAQRLQVRVFEPETYGAFCMSNDRKLAYVPAQEDIYQVDVRSGNRTRLDLPPLADAKELTLDPRGNIWIVHRYAAGKANLYRLRPEDPSSLTRIAVPPDFQYVQTVTRDHIWLHTFRECWLFHLDEASNFDPARPEISPIDVLPGHYPVLTDRSGLVWLGTNGLGIMKINLRSGGFHHLFQGQSIFGHVMQDRQGNVFGYNNIPNMIFSTELAGGSDRPAPFWAGVLLMHHSLQVLQDRGGNYWIACKPMVTSEFLLKKNDPAGGWATYTMPTDQVDFDHILLYLDEKEHPWIVLQGQLLHFDPATERFDKFDYRQAMPDAIGPTALAKSGDGSWWIGTDKGLVRGKPAGQGFAFTGFKNNPASRNSLRENLVASLLADPSDPNILWIGTKGGGLNRLDTRTLQFTHLTTREGLPNNVIYGILPDDEGNLWMSSNKGLICYTPATGVMKNYTKEDGVQDNEFNTWAYFKGPGGHLLFGGVNGLTVFHPRELVQDTVVPRTLINGLRANDREVTIGDGTGVLKEAVEFTREIVLPFSKNSLTLEFVALNFVSPAKNRFRYYLEGAEEEWAHESVEHTASYLNLAPGTYVFRVKGSNSQGVWSQQPAELKITILPPWYRSWLAWIAYVLLLGGGAYAFYRYQLGRKLEHAENLRLKEMDSFKSRFFTNVTHEFRTPLTVILGMTDRLEKTGKDESQRTSALQLIRRNGQNLLRLINEILDLSKLETNTLKMNYVQGDVLAYLRYISESLHSLANAKNVMLRVESGQARIDMDYDPERLLQIVYNLLSNAIKFTPGGGRVVLRAEQAEGWLQIEVTDTGVGIPPEDLPHIFERFFQATNQPQQLSGGTGVGLALTRELVRAMGGEISAASMPGKGASFQVRLPVTRNAAPAKADFDQELATSPVAATKIPAPAARPPGDEIPQLLLVEDNPDVVEYLRDCLADRYQLDFAYNGRAGIEKALETIPDIIISDVMMPEKDGFELCDALKNDERTSHIPIVLLTARATVEDRIAGLRRGADAYLAKPFNPEELLVTLENLTSLRARLQARYAGGQSPAPTADRGLQIEDAFLHKVRAAIEAHLSDSDFEMPQLERKMAMSRSQIFRKMKALTGKSPSQFIRSTRLEKARDLLVSSQLTVSEIAYKTGFSSLQYFSDAFLEEFGQRPSTTRN